MNISLFSISREQTNLIKATGIILIVLHNFIHWTNGIGENEMAFGDAFFRMTEAIRQNPASVLNGLLTCFGHYGVQLFIFISGYGLAKKYRNADKIDFKSYIVHRLVKIYGLMLFGILIYFIISLPGSFSLSFIKRGFLTVTTFRNFFLADIFDFIGPWWFFGLIIQLYFFFPFFFSILKKYKEKGFLVVMAGSYLGIYLLLPVFEKYGLALFGIFLGHFPEFVLGMGMALFSRFRISWKIVLASLAVFLLSNVYKAAFPLSFLSATILLMVACYGIYTHISARGMKILAYVGSVSMYIFIINGPLRSVTIPFASGQPALIIVGISVLHLLFSIGVAQLMAIIYGRIEPLLDKLEKKLAR